jgi:hypothetical protein
MIQRICRSETSYGASAAPARRVAAGTIPRVRVNCREIDPPQITINAETAEAGEDNQILGSSACSCGETTHGRPASQRCGATARSPAIGSAGH